MKIDQDIADVLRASRFEGNRLVLQGQLDRKLYARVNDVIAALGGEWKSGKVKAHVFAGDARAAVEAALDAGIVKTAREAQREDGWFPTPDALAHEIVARAGVKFGDRVLEPSAGEGAIVGAALDAGALVVAVEMDAGRMGRLYARHGRAGDRLAVHTADFLALTTGKLSKFDAIVMNPPFSAPGRALADVDHVEHALTFLHEHGCLVAVMGAGVRFRKDRRAAMFRTRIAAMGGAFEELPAGSFRASGTDVNAVVLTVRGGR